MLGKSNGLKPTLIFGLLLLCFLAAPEIQAWKKNIRFDRLSTEHGLSHVMVDSIAQDHQGFMWFGAQDGLNKYDGYRFTFYGHDPNDPTSISQGQVMDVFVNSQGVLWAAADELNRFDREQETFTRFSHDPEDPGSISGMVNSIFEDREGTMWFGTWSQGLNRYDSETESFTHFQHDPADPYSLPAGIVRAIYEDSDGVLWVGTYANNESANLVRFDPASETFQPILSCTDNQSGCAQPRTEADRPPFAQVAGMLEDRSGTLWIGGYGVIRYDKDSNSYRRYFNDPDNDNYPHINNFSGEFVEDQSGLLWFGETYSGLHSFEPDTEAFTQYLNDPANPNSLGADSLYTIFEGRGGLIWTASYFGGVSRFNPQNLAFGHYKHDSNDPTSLAKGRVHDIAEDADGILWVAAGGLNKIDRNKGVIAHYQYDPDDPDSLHSNDIRTLLVDDKGILWMGTVNGLSRFDPATERFQHFPIRLANNPQDNAIRSLSKDANGTLWLGTDVAIFQFDPETGELNYYKPEMEVLPESMGGYFVVMHASSGHIWINTTHTATSLFRFDPRTETFTSFEHDPQNAHSLSNSGVINMYEASDGDIWLGMMSGIDRFDPENEQFIHYQNTPGLPKGSVNGIIEDLGGHLWFTSWGSGVTRFNPADGTSKTFNRYDGLQGDFLTEGMLSQTGEIILAGENGLNIFDPESLPEQQANPVVTFTDFRLLNASVAVSRPATTSPLSSHINTNPDITLTHRDYLLSFEFADVGFTNPMATQYAYQLEGFDRDWIETDATNRNATYTNLPAGDYVLKVKAAKANGPWSSMTSLNLKILPPPWKTWWAYTLYIATSALLLFAFIRWRTVSLQRRTVELETTVEKRTRQIREHEQLIQHQADSVQELLHLKEKLYANVSHEFRTPLALILGPIRHLLRKGPDIESREQLQVVQRNSERLLRLVDQLLALSRLSARQEPSASAQPLVPHVKALVQSFRPLAVDRGLSLTTGKSEDLWVNCGSDSLEKILMNLLSNAIKYTPAGGRITVDVQAEDDKLAMLCVTDSGIGIPEEEHEAVFDRFHRIGDVGETVPGAGIGLALVKELVESFGGTISLDSAPGEGTTVKVILPRHETAGSAEINQNEVQVSPAAQREVSSLAQPGVGIMAGERDLENGLRSVLLVEDNPDMQNYLHDLLDPTYECLVAGDGHTGLEMALEQIPDLVLTDVMMPGMDGYELTEALKEDQRTSHIPIIMLTARSDRESRLKGLREHADDYLIKPFDDEELLLRISNQLAARDIMKARFSRRVYLEEPLATGLNEREKAFLERFESLLDENFSDPNLDSGAMASKMAVSTRQLQRKLKALTNHSPAEYLRAYRLKEAARLLASGKQIVQVAMDVGFSSQAYFGTCFKAQYGMSPGQYQR